jgi:bis(5'-nucleosyl)-tetraphosphatase (symmetrical)
MPTYAIGDVHGCLATLERLLARLAFDPTRDRLWFVGDLVNRGPRSLETLRFVRGLGDAARVVLGNHDLRLLAIAASGARRDPRGYIDDVLGAPDRDELCAWLRQRPLFVHDGSHALVHAGLLPRWTLGEAAALAGEAEVALRGPDHAALLTAYREHLAQGWHAGLRGIERQAAILTVLTKLRVCDASGDLALGYDGGLADVPRGLTPWFLFPQRRQAEATIVFGHWSNLGLYRGAGVRCLDTACVRGGSLAALRLDDDSVVQEDVLDD